MNTNMTGLDDFQNSLLPCALDKSSLSSKGLFLTYPAFI